MSALRGKLALLVESGRFVRSGCDLRGYDEQRAARSWGYPLQCDFAFEVCLLSGSFIASLYSLPRFAEHFLLVRK